MNTLFSFILVLGLLIFVHELGHFLIAKLFRVRVLKFSLGFGPKLFGRVIGETEYVVSALPLGGYVKMFGENPDEQNVPEDDKKVSFAHKSVLQRFLIILAGPVFNLFFPVVLFFFLFSVVGVPEQVETTRIGVVNEGSPAWNAGIQKGDVFLQIDGRPTEQWVDVLHGVKESGGEEMVIVLQRGEEVVEVRVKPELDDAKNVFGEVVEERFMIGIMKDNEVRYTSVGPLQALQDAFSQTWLFIYLTGMGLVKIFQQIIPASELGGPILIAQLAGEQMREGWINLTYFIGLLSVNLGILNLLPIPVLDGGHLVFLTVEAIRKKPMNERGQIIAQQIGLAVLGTLMIFVFYNDIARLFQ
ncbi:MAG: RIP metalloprotease RseP [Desulfopila sp.]|jgi:regulator of sigma E protease|nr:RIP metalloprotease RseP [Desulfopila sp.]